jgi:hypothetical protein
MAKVRKVTFQVTFLYDEECNPEAEIRGMHVDDILTEMDSGHFVGDVGGLTISDVLSPEEIQTELLAVRNDGTFFDEDEFGDTDE